MTDGLIFNGVRVYAEGSGRACVSLDPHAVADLRNSEFVGGYYGVHIGECVSGAPIVRVDGKTVTIASCSVLAGSDERAWLRYVKWRTWWRAVVRWFLWWRR